MWLRGMKVSGHQKLALGIEMIFQKHYMFTMEQ